MLEIFTDRTLFDEKDFIFDNEAFFMVNPRDNKVMSNVIQAIENGKYLDEKRFYDRFGIAIYCSNMSTGAKTLINIASSDKVINGNEMGSNAREYMVWCIDGKVYLNPSHCVELQGELDLSRIRVNGKNVESLEDLEAVL